MSCSLDKTRNLAIKQGVSNKFDELASNTGEGVTKFNQFVKAIKDLAVSKYGEAAKTIVSPMRLDGKKIKYNNSFFNFVDGQNKAQSKSALGEVQPESVLTPILEDLKTRFNVAYTFVNDPNLDWAGEYDFATETVQINLAKASLDTPFHEFAHPFIRVVRNTNRPLYNKLVQEINNSKQGKLILEEVNTNYPNLSDVDKIEEAIVTAIGFYAQNAITNTSLKARVKEFLQDILDKLGLTTINPKDLSTMTLSELGALMAGDQKVDVSEAKKFSVSGETAKSTSGAKFNMPKQPVTHVESPFEKQFVFFKRRISDLEKDLKNVPEGTVAYEKLKDRIENLRAKLEKAYKDQDKDEFTELGNWALDFVQNYIAKVALDPASADREELLYAVDVLETFYDYAPLASRSQTMFEQIFPILSQHNINIINQFSTEKNKDGTKKVHTEEDIDKQTEDIGYLKAGVGALADLANYIGRTIGSLIKAAHNRASKKNKAYRNEVQKHVDNLMAYATANGKTLEEVYNMLIVETDNNLKLIPANIKDKNNNWVENPKFKAIQNSKALLDFYNFYQQSLKNAEANLPYKVGKHHIPNIHKSDFKYNLKNILASHTVLYDQFKSNEDLYADMIPQQFRSRVSPDKKSRDLGASLLEFVAYTNTYNELSSVLPEARLLQQQLKWKKLADGSIKKREFTKSSEKGVRIFAEDTHLYKMINTIIDMQLKGNMTKKEGEFKALGKKVYDKDGKEVGYTAHYWSGIADIGLKYNSMLRIGFSPITAISNVLFGDIANIIEGFGGRHFTVGNLHTATSIFHSGVFTKDSPLNKYLEALNPLQELDDYNITEGVKLKKMSSEKLQEYMYGMQKQGELFLQSRTMLAVMLKENLIDSTGELTVEGKKIFGGEINGVKVAPNEAAMEQLSDKIQRLNQFIHGRYSRREAAAMQQSVWYRLAIQFRKWIPSAIESRFGEKQYDNRLGVEIEGRYLTLARLVGSKDVLNNLIKMSKGELSELEMYNMRKTLVELTIMAFVFMSYLMLSGGDDDEDKERRKNPYAKIALTLLNRVGGDIGFFYNPMNINNLAKNAFPIAKTVEDLMKVVENIPAAFYMGEHPEYRRGAYKGQNKFYVNLKKVLILAKPTQDVFKLMNDNPLEF